MTPYAQHVGTHDPVDVLRSSFAEYQRVIARVTPTLWHTPWAPGKWTVHQIIVHVTQWEMIMGIRFRFALGDPSYVVQPFDQDPLMPEAAVVDGPMAWAAFEGVRRMNLTYASSLTPAQRKQQTRHPERGVIDVNDLLTTLAGHGVHHLKQIQPMV